MCHILVLQLNAYLDRGRWEKQHKAQKQQQQIQNNVGPAVTAIPATQPPPSSSTGNPLADAMKKTIETFLQRMTSVSSSGKSIATDASVQVSFFDHNDTHTHVLTKLELCPDMSGHVQTIYERYFC